MTTLKRTVPFFWHQQLKNKPTAYSIKHAAKKNNFSASKDTIYSSQFDAINTQNTERLDRPYWPCEPPHLLRTLPNFLSETCTNGSQLNLELCISNVKLSHQKMCMTEMLSGLWNKYKTVWWWPGFWLDPLTDISPSPQQNTLVDSNSKCGKKYSGNENWRGGGDRNRKGKGRTK